MHVYSGNPFFVFLFLTLMIFSQISTYSVLATGQEGSEDKDFVTINSTNNTLANLTAESQISPYSSFVLLSYSLSPIINYIGVFCIVTCIVRFMHSNPL